MSNILKLVEICAVDEVTQLLRRDHRNVNETDGNLNTPLHIAFAKGNGGLVLSLINAGADPTKMNRDGSTPRELVQDRIDQSVMDVVKKYEATFAASALDTPRVQPDGELINTGHALCDEISIDSICARSSEVSHGLYRAEYRGVEVVIDERVSGAHQSLLGALSRLRHPNICLFMGATYTQSRLASLVFECCAGGPLDDAMKAVQFSNQQKIKILSDLTTALHYMHSQKQPICHMNLSTNSLVLDTVVKSDSDFVIVKLSNLTGIEIDGDSSRDILELGRLAFDIFIDMPRTLKRIFEECRSTDPSKRPKANEICRVLRTEN